MLNFPTKSLAKSSVSYASWIILFCLAYLAMQLGYIFYSTFSLDDFWLAYHTYHYKSELPYRDFLPYKTVLGYYLFLIPMLISHGLLGPLYYTKVWIALLNTVFLIGNSLWLKKFFSSKAIFITLTLLIPTQIFLSYSSDIRVDLLSYWLCLISVIFIFDEKYFLAGLTICVGFLICQKAIWYFVATNIGLAGYWLCTQRNWKMVKQILSFNFSALITLSVYIIFWAYFSDLHTVLKSLFYEPYLISSADWYVNTRISWWGLIISNNPGFFLLWPFALCGLMILPAYKRVFVGLYASVILYFVFSCKQPFQYYPLAAVPALLILYVTIISSLESALLFFPLTNLQKNLMLGFSALYLVGLVLCYSIFIFPHAYLLAALIPILTSTMLLTNVGHDIREGFIWVCFFVVILLSTVFPLLRFISILPESNGRYQKSMIHLMSNLLNEGEGYVAGVPLLRDKEQPVPGLVHLVAPSIDYISHPSKKLYPLMTLSSLYLAPVTVPEIIASIEKTPVKLYVDNDRFHFLPKEFHQYLNTQYQHFWGSIFLYAPEVPSGHRFIEIKFPANYKVNSRIAISLDNIKRQPNSIIYLTRGKHLSAAVASYRLKLIPEHVKNLLEPQYKTNNWQILLD